MRLLFQAIWILPIILDGTSFCLAILNATYEWKYIDYAWRSDCQKSAAIEAGIYDYTNIIPNDVQILQDGRVLVTTPRYFNNPASLSTISEETGDGGPLLNPYPSWAWHNRKDCKGITSVNRVFLDDCNRLWIVDSGKIGNEQVCPAKILAFNPENDKLIIELIIPIELTHNANNKSQGRVEVSGVETSGKFCRKTWVYIADPEGYGLVIWDMFDIWRLNDVVFEPEPDQTTLSIAGENFTLSIGLSSFYITPRGFLRHRGVFFKALSAVTSYGFTLEDLHNSKFGSAVDFYRSPFLVPSQELAGAYTQKGGILIVNFPTETALACWNLQYTLALENISTLAVDEETLQFASGIKVTIDSESESQTLAVVTNRLQRFILGTVDFDEINFRILTGDIDTLVNGTVCEPLEEYDIENGIEVKGFPYFKTEDNALFKIFPLYRDAGTLEECDLENDRNDKSFLYQKTSTGASFKGCRLTLR